MSAPLLPPPVRPSSLLPIAAVVLAAAIFVADTLTNLEIAMAVFYTAVILISVRFCSKRGMVFVGGGCIALTLISNLLTPQTNANVAGVINTAISILAIVSTTYLAVKIETVERSVYEARAQLAHVARVTALGELTASLAHEVNQPITAMAANASASLRWLSAEPPNLAEATAAIERIVKDAARAGSIVDRIRGLAKRTPARLSLCEVNDVIIDITTLTASELRKRHVVLRTDLNAGLPKVSADPVQLQQVILNLVMNAIEAMDAVPESKRSLFIGSAGDQSGVTVTVRDSGPGLKVDADAERIFGPFFSSKVNGMGLGLTITRSIVESHGGRIWTGAQGPGGATFCFTLPACEPNCNITYKNRRTRDP
ncbi:MAG TPA: ATP-binding protein [Lacipirellulaceae bacterium]|nr:ATP-binding protein [Lacipirellulaceae bacterium]